MPGVRQRRLRRHHAIAVPLPGLRHTDIAPLGTVFHRTLLPLTKWFQGMYLLTQSKNSVSTLENTVGKKSLRAFRACEPGLQLLSSDTTREPSLGKMP